MTAKENAQHRKRKDRRQEGRSLVEDAGLTSVRAVATPDGDVVELDPTDFKERRVAVFLPDNGVDVIVEVSVPATSRLRAAAQGSDEVYSTLGRLSSLTTQHDILPSLSVDHEGVPSLLLRAHRCHVTPKTISETTATLTKLAADVEVALAQVDEGQALDERLTSQLGKLEQTKVDGDPVIVPTFDPEQMLRMVELSDGLKAD